MESSYIFEHARVHSPQIVASMGARVATWAMSGVQSDTWRVHTSLLLPEGLDITTLDCQSGTVFSPRCVLAKCLIRIRSARGRNIV